MQNYFALFSLPVSFDMDLDALEKAYFAAQRAFHPDRLIGKSGHERQQAIQQSMQANEGYDVLKSPLKRAQHMLALQGIMVGGEQDSVKPSPAILMETMEARERLAEVESVSDLEILERATAGSMHEVIAELSEAFTRKALESAAQLAIRLGYLMKIEQEIRVKKKALS